jgi:RHS repeat-associated protein
LIFGFCLFLSSVPLLAQVQPLGVWPQVFVGMPRDTLITGIAYGNRTWVAVGQNGFIATSTDAQRWTRRSAGMRRDFNGVTFTGVNFVAVAKVTVIGAPEPKIYVSDSNGSRWSPRDTDSGVNFISEGLHGVAGDGMGTVVAVGGAWLSRITVSRDHGNSWNAVNLTPFGGPWGKLYDVAYGDGIWIAVGSGTVLASTTNGATWTKISSDDGRSITYGDKRWVRVDDWGSKVYWAPSDHVNWTSMVWQQARIGTADGSTHFNLVRGSTFYDGLFVTVGEFGDIWTSDNGRVFQRWVGAARQNQGAAMVCVAGGEAGFMAGGRDFVFGASYGALWASPAWMRARLGSTSDYPYTVFDYEESEPTRIDLPQYRINTSSLNLLLEGTLFYMQTTGAPIDLRLVYNSAPTKDDSDAIGLFGKNWRMHYESMIGEFGQEAVLITSGGRKLSFVSPEGKNLSSASVGSPIELIAPDGIFDTLTFYGPGQYFEYKEKASKLVYRYAAAGGPGNSNWRLTRITDRSGNQVNLTVDAATGKIDRITDPTGRFIAFTYNSDNLCTSIHVPGGRQIKFEYDTRGSKTLLKITDMAGHTANYAYDAMGFITQMNVAGRRTRFSYAERPGFEDKNSAQDNAGDKMIATVVDPAGGTTKYEILKQSNEVRRTDSRGLVTLFSNEEGNTSRVVDPLGKVRTIEFSNAKLPAVLTKPNGTRQTYQHDKRGNLISLTDARNKKTTYAYDARDNLVSVTNALGQKMNYTYDAKDRVTSVTSPLGHKTELAYLANGRLDSLKDARTHITRFAYDANGHLNRVTDPLGNLLALTGDSVGRVTAATDQVGNAKTFSYDANDRIREVVYTSAPDSPKRTNTFDAFGQTRVTDPMGRITKIERNEFGYPTLVSDPLGYTVRTVYDPSNNPVKVTDPLERVISTTYDRANRPLVVTDAMGKQTTHTYDDNGNLTEFIDTKRNKTTFEYDATDQLISTTDALRRKQEITRDDLGRVSTITNARNQRVGFTYDADGRRTGKYYIYEGDRKENEVTYQYDANGNLTQMVDDWGTTTLTYDANNRPVSMTYPGGKTVTFTYNKAGLPSTMTYPNGLVVNYTYDAFNRIASPTMRRSGNLLGNAETSPKVTSLTISKGTETHTINYEYDASAMLTKILRPGSAPTTDITYDEAGRVASLIHRNGASDLVSYTYELDGAGNIVQSQDSGLWLQEAPLPEPTRIAYDRANQITNHNGRRHQHDADGNRISVAGEFTATYNAENRPTQIQRLADGAMETINYTYDGNGLRVKREVVGGDSTHFHYGPGGELLFTTDASGNILECFVWRGSSLAASLAGSTLDAGLSFPLSNHLGNVVARVDPDGNARSLTAYQSYGGYDASPGTVLPGLFSFVGALGVQDEGHGLYYMRNRFYDAKTGRFLQQDPIGLEGGINLYAYADGNPFGRVDPNGTSAVFIGVSIGITAYSIYQIYSNFSKSKKEAGKARTSAKYASETYSSGLGRLSKATRDVGNLRGDEMLAAQSNFMDAKDEFYNESIPEGNSHLVDAAGSTVRATYRGTKAIGYALSLGAITAAETSSQALEQVGTKVWEDGIRDPVLESTFGLD